MKKTILTIGSIVSVVAPIVAVVSCGDKEESKYFSASIDGSNANIKIVTPGRIPPEHLSEAQIMTAYNHIKDVAGMDKVTRINIQMQNMVEDGIAQTKLFSIDIEAGQGHFRDAWINKFRLTKGHAVHHNKAIVNEASLIKYVDSIEAEQESIYTKDVLKSNLANIKVNDLVDPMLLGLPTKFPAAMEDSNLTFEVKTPINATTGAITLEVKATSKEDSEVSAHKEVTLKPSTDASSSFAPLVKKLDGITLMSTRTIYDFRAISGTGTADVDVTETLLGINGSQLLKINKLLFDGMSITYKVKPSYVDGYMKVYYTLDKPGETPTENEGSFDIFYSPSTASYDMTDDAAMIKNVRSSMKASELKESLKLLANLEGATEAKELGIKMPTFSPGVKYKLSTSTYSGHGDVAVHYELDIPGFDVEGKSEGVFIVKPLDGGTSSNDLSSLASKFVDVDSTLTQSEIRKALVIDTEVNADVVQAKLGITPQVTANDLEISYSIGSSIYDCEENIHVVATVTKRSPSWTLTNPTFVSVDNNVFEFNITPKRVDMKVELDKIKSFKNATMSDANANPLTDENILLGEGKEFEIANVQLERETNPAFMDLDTNVQYFVKVPYDRFTKLLTLEVVLSKRSAPNDTLFSNNRKLVTLQFN